MKRLFALLFAVAVLSGQAGAETYQIDPVHSDVRFSVSHMVGKVSGRFGKFEGTVDYVKGDPKAWKVDARIEAASIDTNNEDRDKHLRAADFLDSDKHPAIAFKSTKVAGLKGEKAKLHGDTSTATAGGGDLDWAGWSRTPGAISGPERRPRPRSTARTTASSGTRSSTEAASSWARRSPSPWRSRGSSRSSQEPKKSRPRRIRERKAAGRLERTARSTRSRLERRAFITVRDPGLRLWMS